MKHQQVRQLAAVLLLLLAAGRGIVATTLSDAALIPYGQYVERARQAFLDRLKQPVGQNERERAMLRSGQTSARPGYGDGIQAMSGTLVHHWRAAAFIPDTTLDQSLAVSHAYRDYASIFHPVVAATVLSEDGDALRVQFRMKQSAGGLTSTLDLWSNIRYTRVDPTRAYVISMTDTVREVQDAGRATEHYAAPGHENGYLWRGATLTRFVQADGGVYMEMETIGLSRSFPPLLGWVIEPIARRIGRGSVENSVQEFRSAVLTRRS